MVQNAKEMVQNVIEIIQNWNGIVVLLIPVSSTAVGISGSGDAYLNRSQSRWVDRGGLDGLWVWVWVRVWAWAWAGVGAGLGVGVHRV